MFFEEIKINMTVEIAPVVIKKEKMLEFALSYDNLPIHTDEEYANKVLYKNAMSTLLKN